MNPPDSPANNRPINRTVWEVPVANSTHPKITGIIAIISVGRRPYRSIIGPDANAPIGEAKLWTLAIFVWHNNNKNKNIDKNNNNLLWSIIFALCQTYQTMMPFLGPSIGDQWCYRFAEGIQLYILMACHFQLLKLIWLRSQLSEITMGDRFFLSVYGACWSKVR